MSSLEREPLPSVGGGQIDRESEADRPSGGDERVRDDDGGE